MHDTDRMWHEVKRTDSTKPGDINVSTKPGEAHPNTLVPADVVNAGCWRSPSPGSTLVAMSIPPDAVGRWPENFLVGAVRIARVSEHYDQTGSSTSILSGCRCWRALREATGGTAPSLASPTPPCT
jgi:hypothetical protein